jgi:hypothetical protein
MKTGTFNEESTTLFCLRVDSRFEMVEHFDREATPSLLLRNCMQEIFQQVGSVFGPAVLENSW